MKSNVSTSGFLCLFAFFLVISVTPCFAVVTGTVTDTSGSPVFGALVTFTDESDTDNEYSAYTDEDGNYSINITSVSVKEETPANFQLRQNYPNPFNPSTTIPFSLNEAGFVNLSIYNITGQKVRTLVDSYHFVGSHTAVWNGLDDNNKSVAAGIYIYQLKFNDNVESRKMLLIDGGSFSSGIPSDKAVKRIAKTAKRHEASLYTVSVLIGGYHDYVEEKVNIDTNSTYNITLIAYQSTYETGSTDSEGQVGISSYAGDTIKINLKGAGDIPVEGIDVYTISNSYGTTVICSDSNGNYFDSIEYIPSSSGKLSKPAPIIVWDFSLYEITKNSEGNKTDRYEGDTAVRIWKDLQGLHKANPGIWNEVLPGEWESYDGWNKLEKVTVVMKIGLSPSSFSILIRTSVEEQAKTIIANEYDRLKAKIRIGDDWAILANDMTVLSDGLIIGKVLGDEIALENVEISLTGGPSTNIDPVISDWCGIFQISDIIPGTYTLHARETSPMTITVGESHDQQFWGRSGEPIIISPVRFRDYGDVSSSINIKSGENGTTLNLNYQKLTDVSPIMYYRKNGETSFSSTAMTLVQGSNDAFKATIPGDIVTTAGVEFKIEGTHSGKTVESPVYSIPVAGSTTNGGTHEYKNITFVSIPGETFQMGDEDGEWSWAMPVHTVTVSGFKMSETEITNEQYAAYLNEALTSGDINQPSSGSVTGKTGDYSGEEYIYIEGYYSSYPDNDCKITHSSGSFTVKSGYEKWPVAWVTWYGAKAFALYYGLDLPREAEWEYAARGGKQYKYGTDDGTISTNKANYWETGIKHPVDVGSYPSNPFGLKDMSGNLWEWCNDWYDDYSSGSATNPTGALTGSDRVLRGGSWGNNAEGCRSARRDSFNPASRYSYVGFRVVRR